MPSRFLKGEQTYADRFFQTYRNGTEEFQRRRGKLHSPLHREHTHEDSCEIIYVLSGTASIVCDGVSETVEAGQAHYCPKGSTHVMKNNGDRDLVVFAVVPKQ